MTETETRQIECSKLFSYKVPLNFVLFKLKGMIVRKNRLSMSIVNDQMIEVLSEK